jgi:gliding motility-associated-like protein
LNAGTYTVLVTDVNSCTATNTITVTQPAALSNTLAVSSNYNGQNVSCNGSSNGAIDLTVTGGTTSYTYLWSSSATTQDISGLTAGIYSVTITDANGCTKVDTVSLSQPLPLVLTSAITNVTCNGFSNGSIDLSISGGTAGYNYSWSNASTTQDITGISAGNYTVLATDINGCTTTLVNTVNENQSLLIASSAVGTKCNKSSDGEITTSVFGGASPYQYTWSTGASTQNITGLSAGTYILSVTDSNSCFLSDTFIIAEPDTISASYITSQYANGFNITLFGASDGFIDLTVAGGTNPYSYFWSTGETTEDINFVPAGSYFVQITDSNGCVIIVALKLTEPFALEMPTGMSPNADGNNDYFVIHGLESYPDNKIAVYNRWGNLVYTEENYKNDWNGKSKTGDGLPDATYFVVLTISSPEKITLTGYVDIRR